MPPCPSRLTTLAVALATLAMAGCTSSRPSRPAGGVVHIKTFIFRPDPVRIRAGTTVTWDNQDDILHTITSGRRNHPTRLFDHKLNLHDKFSYAFKHAGTYHYVCTIHMGMDGTVIVS